MWQWQRKQVNLGARLALPGDLRVSYDDMPYTGHTSQSPATLLIIPGMGQDPRDWEHYYRRLSPWYRILAPYRPDQPHNLPGRDPQQHAQHRYSDPLPANQRWAPTDFAAFYRAFLDELAAEQTAAGNVAAHRQGELTKVVLVAHSQGALWAMQLAADDGVLPAADRRVAGALLVDPNSPLVTGSACEWDPSDAIFYPAPERTLEVYPDATRYDWPRLLQEYRDLPSLRQPTVIIPKDPMAYPPGVGWERISGPAAEAIEVLADYHGAYVIQPHQPAYHRIYDGKHHLSEGLDGRSYGHAIELLGEVAIALHPAHTAGKAVAIDPHLLAEGTVSRDPTRQPRTVASLRVLGKYGDLEVPRKEGAAGFAIRAARPERCLALESSHPLPYGARVHYQGFPGESALSTNVAEVLTLDQPLYVATHTVDHRFYQPRPTVVCFNDVSLADWATFTKRNDYVTMVLDLLGVCGSARPPAAWSLEQEAAAFAHVIAAQADDGVPVTLVGRGLGADAALRLAASARLPLHSVCAITPSAKVVAALPRGLLDAMPALVVGPAKDGATLRAHARHLGAEVATPRGDPLDELVMDLVATDLGSAGYVQRKTPLRQA